MSMIRRRKREAIYFDQLKIKLLVFGEDSVDYYTPQLIRLGHSKNVKSVVFPYTFANQFEFLEDAYFNDRRVNSNFLNRVIGKIFPKWTYLYKGKILLKSYPSLILSTELFKLSPPNPWVMSSGFSDVIAVESPFMKQYYEKAGIPSNKMIETGYPSLDSVHHFYKNKLERKADIATKLKLDIKKPFILCAVPPSQWPRPGVGFDNYDQFLKEFFEYLANFTDAEIIYKFHPRMDAEEIAQIGSNYNIRYSLSDTAELIAISDMYLASVSSTIRWALALGLSTINYDLYDYGYGDFDGSRNVQTVVTFGNFKTAFEKQYKFLVQQFKNPEFDRFYGNVDGHSGDRIIKLFLEMT